jgi:hypothetical protein
MLLKMGRLIRQPGWLSNKSYEQDYIWINDYDVNAWDNSDEKDGKIISHLSPDTEVEACQAKLGL